MAGVVTAAAVSMLLAVVAAIAVASGASLDFASFATDCVTVAVDETLVVGDAVVVAASAAPTCVGFDPLLAGVGVCSGSGAVVVGGALGWVGSVVTPDPADSLGFGCVSTALGGAAVPDSAVLVCAPPLLLTVTPVAIWSVEDVAPEAFVVSAAVVTDDVETVPVVAADDSPSEGFVDAESADVEEAEDSDEVSVVSAEANPNPYPVETAPTSHAVTASPPTPTAEAILGLLLDMASLPFVGL